MTDDVYHHYCVPRCSSNRYCPPPPHCCKPCTYKIPRTDRDPWHSDDNNIGLGWSRDILTHKHPGRPRRTQTTGKCPRHRRRHRGTVLHTSHPKSRHYSCIWRHWQSRNCKIRARNTLYHHKGLPSFLPKGMESSKRVTRSTGEQVPVSDAAVLSRCVRLMVPRVARRDLSRLSERPPSRSIPPTISIVVFATGWMDFGSVPDDVERQHSSLFSKESTLGTLSTKTVNVESFSLSALSSFVISVLFDCLCVLLL